MPLSWEDMRARLPALLKHIPSEWRGTTFRNKVLHLREGFGERLDALLARGDDAITTEALRELGNAEDYLRVATNLSVVLERALALRRGVEPAAALTFASELMPIVAVLMTHAGRTVHLYHGAGAAPPVSGDLARRLSLAGGLLEQHAAAPPRAGQRPHGDEAVLATGVALGGAPLGEAEVDGVIEPCVLYAVNARRVVPSEVLVIRKRMSTPVTTPVAEAMLRALAGGGAGADVDAAARGGAPPPDAEVLQFYEHLEELSGGTSGTEAPVAAAYTAGLPTLASLWFSLIGAGGADVLMCSTSYGGSSQLVDILSERSDGLAKHTFDIQGSASIVPSIRVALDALAAGPLLPTTVLFVEVPTNPDMKVPNVGDVAAMLRAYRERTGKRVLLLVDATFAPGSQVLRQVAEAAPELAAFVFLSMSKSVSRGMTTAGALVANHTPDARTLLEEARATGRALDTLAKPDQLHALVENHRGVEDRCARAYENAVALGDVLRGAVREHAPGSPDMPLAFVSKEHAALGFTSSTFSFNLPPARGATADDNAALAQRFVDALCRDDKHFKPCVSFGQDNGLVYATVPATSTQGAIKAEHKDKQAVGGVQLVRLSFPPTFDTATVGDTIATAVADMYA